MPTKATHKVVSSRLGRLAAIAVLALPGWPAAAELEARGILSVDQEVVVSAEMQGKVDRMPVDEGDRIAAGDLMALFACGVRRAELAKAQAALRAARAELANLERLAELDSAGEVDLQLADAKAAEERADVDVALARVRRCRITAPFDGRVLERLVEPHESVDVMTPLLRIANLAPMQVKVIVPARWLRHIAPGTPFSFTAEALDDALHGHVSKLGAIVDPSSQTMTVEGVLDSDTAGTLPPGLGGSVTFLRSEAESE